MKYIPISKLEPDTFLARDVILPNGKILLKQGAKLDTYYIETIRKYDIESVCIASEEELKKPGVTDEEFQMLKQLARDRKKVIFKYALIDSKMKELYEAIILHTAWEMSREE